METEPNMWKYTYQNILIRKYMKDCGFPKKRQWSLSQIVDGKGLCVCKHKLKKLCILKSNDGDMEMILGSTCLKKMSSKWTKQFNTIRGDTKKCIVCLKTVSCTVLQRFSKDEQIHHIKCSDRVCQNICGLLINECTCVKRCETCYTTNMKKDSWAKLCIKCYIRLKNGLP